MRVLPQQGGDSSQEHYHPWSTFADARDEAIRRGDRPLGTEHLLVALLRDPAIAAAVGSDAQAARDALAAIDAEALAAIGLVVPAGVAQPAPLGNLGPRRSRPSVREVMTGRFGMTPNAKRVLQRTGREIMRGREEGLGGEQIALAMLELDPPDPVAHLLDVLGVDRGAARTRLLALVPHDASAA